MKNFNTIKTFLKAKSQIIKSICLFHKSHQSLKLSYYCATSKHPLLYETIGQRLAVAADHYNDRDAHVFMESGKRVTFKALKQSAEDIAAGLLALGLKRGDRLGLWAPNCAEWVLTQYATALIGVIQVNINPAYQTHELEYSLNKVGCKAIVMYDKYKSQNYLEMLTEICPELGASKPGQLHSHRLPKLKHAIIIGDKSHHGTVSFNQLENMNDSQYKKLVEKVSSEIQPSDPINIQYTSGTTGSPKGVTLSHHMILNNANQISQLLQYHKNRIKICVPVPLYHCFGMVMASLSTITAGTTCVYPGSVYNPENNLKTIEIEKCTTFYGTPTMFIDLLTHQNLENFNVSSLFSGIMAGSTCPSEVVSECVKKLNTKDIVVVYGLTETSPAISSCHVEDTLENRTQTIGKPLEHVECKIVNEKNQIVPIGQPGELLVRGYLTMIGYYNDKQKTEETFTPDRFLRTGDVVSMDKNGYMKHLSRLKDMVIRGGENIYPREIEDFLHQNEKIADIYVVGVPDKRMGEELCACVKLEIGESMTPEELKDFCKKKIAHFKIPRYVLFMDSFPMTVTGKIQKNKLREKVIQILNLNGK